MDIHTYLHPIFTTPPKNVQKGSRRFTIIHDLCNTNYLKLSKILSTSIHMLEVSRQSTDPQMVNKPGLVEGTKFMGPLKPTTLKHCFACDNV